MDLFIPLYAQLHFTTRAKNKNISSFCFNEAEFYRGYRPLYIQKLIIMRRNKLIWLTSLSYPSMTYLVL